MPIDFGDGGFIDASGDTGVDSHGHVHVRMDDNMSMDTATGRIHMTSDRDDGDGCGRCRGRRGGGLLSFLFCGDE